MERPAHYTTFADQLDALDDTELHDLATVVAQVESAPGWGALASLAQGVVRRELARLTPAGMPPELVEYVQVHAVVGGIERVLGLPDAVRYAQTERTKQAAEAARGERTAA